MGNDAEYIFEQKGWRQSIVKSKSIISGFHNMQLFFKIATAIINFMDCLYAVAIRNN